MKTELDSRRSFSLIELIVVVAIITILATMIFTVLPKVRAKGRTAQCKANLKQLAVASMSYFHEHRRLPYAWNREWFYWPDEKWYEKPGWVRWLNHPDYPVDDPDGTLLPDGPFSPGDENQNRPRWWGEKGLTSVTNGTLWSYTGKSLRVYVCPEFERKQVVGLRDPQGSVFDEDNPIVRTYSMNDQADGDTVWMGNIRDASKKLLFAEMHLSKDERIDGKLVCTWGCMDDESEFWRPWDGRFEGRQDGTKDYPFESVGDYHNGRVNAVFVDGHIERIRWYDTTNACAAVW